jgi:hypothetical protein
MKSRQPSVIREIFRDRRESPERFHNMHMGTDFIRVPGEIDDVSPVGYLYQAGYLSVRMDSRDSRDFWYSRDRYAFDYPNAEVRSAIARIFLQDFGLSPTELAEAADELEERLAGGNIPEVIECVYRFFAAVTCPASRQPETRDGDFYHSVMHAFFLSSGTMVIGEW